MTVGSTSALSHTTVEAGDTPLSGPKQGCDVEQGMVLGVLTLKQAEEFKIGHVWYKQFCKNSNSVLPDPLPKMKGIRVMKNGLVS